MIFLAIHQASATKLRFNQSCLSCRTLWPVLLAAMVVWANNAHADETDLETYPRDFIEAQAAQEQKPWLEFEDLAAHGSDCLKSAHWQLVPTSAANVSTRAAAIESAHNKVTVIQLQKSTARPKDVSYSATITRRIADDTSLRLIFFAWSPRREHVEITYENATNRHLPPLWKKVVDLHPMKNDPVYLLEPCAFSFSVPKGEAGQYRLSFQLGGPADTINFGAIGLFDEGRDVARERARPLIAPLATQQRIDKLRRGNLVVQVTDSSGRGLADIKVTVSQKRHQFLFGANVSDLCTTAPTASQLAYQKRFQSVFNLAALPTSWSSLEPQEKTVDYARLRTIALWCKERHIAVLGRELISPQTYPSWAPANPVMAQSAMKAHVFETLNYFSNTISTWEIAANLRLARKKTINNGVLNWVRWLGPSTWGDTDQPVVALDKLLVWSHLADQHQKLTFLYGTDELETLPNFLADKQNFGFMPDAIGIKQAFNLDSNIDLLSLWVSCNDCTASGLPLYVLSLSCASSIVPLKHEVEASTRAGEEAQAQSVERLYRLLFSHPKVRAIIWDGLRDTDSALAPAHGLLHADGSAKPAFNRLTDLITKEWSTNVTSTTDSAGVLKTRAFFGDYEIKVEDHHGHTLVKNMVFGQSQDDKSPFKVVLTP